jgi:hypothetical protein
MSDVTRILSAIEHGDSQASEKLLPLVYAELRRLAAQKMAQESPGLTLQATALVHEAYLRLVDLCSIFMRLLIVYRFATRSPTAYAAHRGASGMALSAQARRPHVEGRFRFSKRNRTTN